MPTERDIATELAALRRQVAQLTDVQQKRHELIEEMMPVLKQVMAVGTERLSRLDEKGYFRFGSALLGVVDRVVTSYTPQDIEQLADNVVTIVDLVRALTQPELLEIANEVTEAASRGEALEPVGIMGVMKASQDEDAQRGMAVLVEALRRLGKGVRKVERRQKLATQLASRAGRRPLTERRLDAASRRAAAPPSRAVAAAAAAASPPPARASVAPGIALTPDGFLADTNQWNRDVAERIAMLLGVTLTERHWKLIEFARGEFAQTGSSPNIRRLTLGSGIPTKELYRMFPSAPGKCTAMIAGLPKPVGCI